MPYAAEANGQPGLPFSGATPLSRLASFDGAEEAQSRSGAQCDRIYQFLCEHGPATDHEISAAVNLPIATICARRNALMQRGQVRACGVKPGPFRARNTVWGAVIR